VAVLGGQNLPDRHRDRFAALRDTDLKTARAGRSRRICTCSGATARPHRAATPTPPVLLDHTLTAATGHRGGTLKCRLRVILFFFSHRITNVAGKSLNSRIQAIRVAARGFRNREHFKTAICLHCPGLDVYPVTHSIAGRARVIGVAEGRWSTPYTLRIRADSDGLLEMFRRARWPRQDHQAAEHVSDAVIAAIWLLSSGTTLPPTALLGLNS
jgi:hypothetical protein